MKAKFICFVLIPIMFRTHMLFGQNATSFHNIHLELLGSSDIYSLNFEYSKKGRQTIQAGISWLPGTWQTFAENDRSFLNIPLIYHYLYGGTPHKLDLSVGILNTFILNRMAPNQYKIRPEFGIAYRYQKKKGIYGSVGGYLKAPFALSMDADEIFLYKENRILPWPSIAMGWSF